MITTDYTINDQAIGYVIEPDKYVIYLGERPWIAQPAELYVEGKTPEENCLDQIKFIVEHFN